MSTAFGEAKSPIGGLAESSKGTYDLRNTSPGVEVSGIEANWPLYVEYVGIVAEFVGCGMVL